MSRPATAVLKTLQPYRRRLVEKAVKDGLPASLTPALMYLATGTRSADAAAATAPVEEIRSRLSKRDGNIPVLYSPKPNSAGEDASEDARPPLGEELEFTYERIALQTSTPARWGSFLHLVAEGSQAATIIELGSCAGIAASYLAVASQHPHVITIEGSASLAAIAAETTAQVSDKVDVHHAYFDDALDRMLSALIEEGIDVAWIDGHHERVATQHYFHRLIPTLRPGALVLFDDISWSQDMHDGWDTLASTSGFSHTVNLGKLGLGVWVGGDIVPRQHDLRLVAGLSRKITTPHGWSS